MVRFLLLFFMLVGVVAYGHGDNVAAIEASEDTAGTYTVTLVSEFQEGLSVRYYELEDWDNGNLETYESAVVYLADRAPTLTADSLPFGDTLDTGESSASRFHDKYAQTGVNYFATRLDGYYYAPTSGTYTFEVCHDDDCAVYIDKQLIYLQRGATFGAWKTFSVELTQGYHELLIWHYEVVSSQHLRFPGIAQSQLYHCDSSNVARTVTVCVGDTLPTIVIPQRVGYTFEGYFTEPNGGGEAYYAADGTSLRDWDIAANTTLYAKWQQVDSGSTYMVIDLSGGTSAESFPVHYLSEAPADGWSDEYKTTKMVLRRIPAGTFMMGSPEDELGRATDGAETQHPVTLTEDFWIGVFEVTQKQWQLVMGNTPSRYSGDMRPVERVCYNDIRGSSLGSEWPASTAVDATSFIGQLRQKIGNDTFDLPTEAQWEYACRAGTTSALNNGKELTINDGYCDNLAEVACYESNNEGTAHKVVGSYRANAWGLYDMHGNIWEWCLDWETRDMPSTAVTDPVGPLSGSKRILRGGCWAWPARGCRSADRASQYDWHGGGSAGDMGFRLCFNEVSLLEQAPDFELGGVSFTNDTGVPWSVTEGEEVLICSGAIEDSAFTTLIGRVTGCGTLSFAWKVSSEANYDYLRFYVDGQEYGALSGEGGDFVTVVAPLTSEGDHTFRWTYSKDGSASRGDDCGWLKNLTWTAGVIEANEPFSYTVSDAGEVTITGYNGMVPSTLIIPATIDDMPVVGITEDAFYRAESLTSVTLLANVKTNLRAFGDMPGLTDFTLGREVVMDIAFDDFDGSDNIRFTVEAGNERYFSHDFGLIDMQEKTLLYAREVTGTYIIPEGVEHIKDKAFWGAPLTGARFPSTLKSVRHNGFTFSSIQEAIFNDGIELMDVSAFRFSSIQRVVFPASLNEIRAYAFDLWSDNGLEITFEGLPPTVLVNNDRPTFVPGAKGYYPAKHAEAWQAVIGDDGTWYNLKMSMVGGGEVLPDEPDTPEVLPEDALQLYMVIDLSGGTSAESFPVHYLSEVPAGGWSDEYKTTKMVLRRIPAGTFMMGSPSGEVGSSSNETLRQVTLSNTYYLGVFEVTQAQWESVMGSNPSVVINPLAPVDSVSYSMMRGSLLGAGWPASSSVESESFIGRLRSKTGYAFDLPTEAQWEKACRAGSSTALYTGKNLISTDQCPNLDEVACYASNSSGTASPVGMYTPNTLGLYDMLGNVWEQCLDWNSSYDSTALSDPVGATSGAMRAERGGGWSNPASYCRAASRHFDYPEEASEDGGLRLCVTSFGGAMTIGFAYTETEGVLTITGYTGSVPSTLSVPSTIEGKPVVAIGANAFAGNTALEAVTLGEGIEALEQNAFGDCSRLAQITLPTSLKRIEQEALARTAVSEVEAPGAESIAYKAFDGCEALRTVKVGDVLATIEACAFYECRALTSFKMGLGAAEIDCPNTQGSDAFHGADEIVFEVAEGNPRWCTVNGVLIDKLAKRVVYGRAAFGDVVIPEGIETVSRYCFGFASEMTSVIFPETLATFEANTFIGTSGITAIHFKGVPPYGILSFPATRGTYTAKYASQWLAVIDSAGQWQDLTMTLAEGEEGDESIFSYEVDESTGEVTLTRLLDSSTTGELRIPETLGGQPVTRIADWAFSNCSGLTTVVIPAGVTAIGQGAFAHNAELTTVVIEGDVTRMRLDAFGYCPRLEEFNLGLTTGQFSNLEDYSPFNGSDGIRFTVSPENTRYEAFNGALIDKLAQSLVWARAVEGHFVIPEGVCRMESRCFANNLKLTAVTFPESLTGLIGERAFEYCENLTDVTFLGVLPVVPSDPCFPAANGHCSAKYADLWYDGLTDGKWYNLTFTPEGESSDAMTFTTTVVNDEVTITGYTGTLPQDLVIPATLDELPVVAIAEGAFDHCNGLRSLTIEGNVRTIAARAFAYCENLATADIGDAVISLPNWAFEGCINLLSVDIGLSTFTLQSHTFCYADDIVFTCDLENEAYEVVGDALIDKRTHTLVWARAGVTGHYDVPEGVTSLFIYAFITNGELTSITFPTSLTSIAHEAFRYCSALKDVTFLGNAVTSVAGVAFYNCDSLETIHFKGPPPTRTFSFPAVRGTYPAAYADEWQAVLSADGKWSNLTMAQAVASADPDTPDVEEPADPVATLFTYTVDETGVTVTGFAEGASMLDLVIPEAIEGKPVVAIGESAFQDETCLTSITLPPSVRRTGARCFENCTNVTAVNLPEGLEALGPSTFKLNSALTEITLPESLRTIGYDAFFGCYSLKTIHIPDGVTSIEYGAFWQCYALEAITFPVGVTTIAQNVFPYCSNLKSVTLLAPSISYPGWNAFYRVAPTDLTATHIPQAMQTQNITTVTIPDGATSIAANAFSACSSLTTVNVAASVTAIGDDAFTSARLETVTFAGLPPMVATDFPVAEGRYPVAYASQWAEVIVDGKWKNLTMTCDGPLPPSPGETPDDPAGEGEIFGPDPLFTYEVKEGKIVILGVKDTSVTTLALPDQRFGMPVGAIGDNAFTRCCALTAVTIPASVTRLGSTLFAPGTHPTITFLGDVPQGFDTLSSGWDCSRYETPEAYATQWNQAFTAQRWKSGAETRAKVAVDAKMLTPKIMQVTYTVTSDLPTVRVRAVAFKDGIRSFANIVPVKSGRDIPNGTAVATNQSHTFVWYIAEDWATRLDRVAVDVLVLEGLLLPQTLRTIPSATGDKQITFSRNPISYEQAFNALVWCYAEGDEALEVSQGVVRIGGLKVADGNKIVVKDTGDASVTTLLNHLYGKLGYRVLSGETLEYVSERTRETFVDRELDQVSVKEEE